MPGCVTSTVGVGRDWRDFGTDKEEEGGGLVVDLRTGCKDGRRFLGKEGGLRERERMEMKSLVTEN